MKGINHRALVVVGAVIGLVAAGATTTGARSATRETIHDSFSFEDVWTCPGITITQTNVERDTFIDVSPTSLHIQRHGVATLEANGKTLTSNFSATIFLNPAANMAKVVGTVYNVQVPGAGNLLLDAGSIVLDITTETPTVLHVGGPHEQFNGDVGALCAYFAGP